MIAVHPRVAADPGRVAGDRDASPRSRCLGLLLDGGYIF